MTSPIHVDMHREHKSWESEISQWRFDIAQWQKQLAALPATIAAINKRLEEHAESLRKHAGSIRMLEQDVGAHEHKIVEYEMGAKGEELPGLAEKHKLETTRQSQQRETHARLKHLHHEIVTQWQHLMNTLGVDVKAEPSSKLIASKL
jgi:chromosome segregation ATPase